MAGNAIGTGALILSANADGLVAGLSKAEKATEKAAKKIADKGREAGAGFKFMEGVVGGLLGGALGGSAGSLVEKLGETAKDAAFGTSKLRDEMERAARANDKLAASMDRGIKVADEWLNTIADPKKKGSALEAQIQKTERMLRDQEALEEAARTRAAKLNDDFSTDALKARFGGRLEIGKEGAANDLAAASAAVDKLTDRLAELREAKARALDPTRNPELVGEVNQLTESLKLQRDTLGMTANQAKLYELRMKGATAAQLEQAQKIADELDAIDKRTAEAGGPKLSGAFERGSKEAYSIVAKFQTGNMQQQDVQRKQLDAINGVKAGVGRVAAELARAQILKAI